MRWTPREMRHSFVSLLDDADVPIDLNSQVIVASDRVHQLAARPAFGHASEFRWCPRRLDQQAASSWRRRSPQTAASLP
jgi:hypothetical protein